MKQENVDKDTLSGRQGILYKLILDKIQNHRIGEMQLFYTPLIFI